MLLPCFGGAGSHLISHPSIHLLPINHRALGRLALRRRCCLRLTVLCAGSLPRAGHIPTPIVNLGTGIVSFIEGELTEIVDRRRVATVADDLKAVAGQIVAGVLHYDTIRPSFSGLSFRGQGS